MSLFFDVEWFEARLKNRGLSRAALAAAAGMSEAELALAFKDQREVSAAEVGAFAEMLGVSAREIAKRAGASTPAPEVDGLEGRLARIEARLAALEAALRRGG